MADNIDNLYRAPSSNVEVTTVDNAGKIWRQSSNVVVTRETVWPKRCIKCNAPTDKSLNRVLAHVNPWIYLSILINLLLTILLALIFQKKFRMDIPVCEQHLAYRKRVILINWMLFVVVLVGFGISIAKISEFGILVSVTALLAMFIFGFSNRLAYISKYKEPYIYVRGAKTEFLDSLDTLDK